MPNLGPSLWSSANWVMRHGDDLFSGDLAKDSRSGPGRSPERSSRSRCSAATQRRRAGRPRSRRRRRRRRRWDRRSCWRCAPFLEPPAIALDNALALQKAEALSVTDDLTRLSNSRYLNLVLRRETKRAVRNGRPLSLLFLDLDGFKQVNDNHGHLAGSKALVEAAAVIATVLA